MFAFRYFASLAVLAGIAAAAFAQSSMQVDADSMREKLAFVVETGNRPRSRPAPPLRTSFSEHEVNAYLDVYGATFLPDGIANPEVRIGDRGRVTVRGVVDLDAVRTSRKRDWLDPMSYVTGSVEVAATGTVTNRDGMGLAELESATLGGVAMPKSLLQELIRFYTTSPQRPQGFGLDEPFEYPANIRSVVFEPGRTVVVSQ
jgi:hypothetical protein